MKLLFLAWWTLVSIPICYSQNASIVTAIKIGDPVPDLPFRRPFDNALKKSSTAQFKGKLLILDFWSTYCSTCVQTFEKAIKLQEKYRDDLMIVAVNDYPGDNTEKINKLVANWEASRKMRLTLPMVMYDSILSKSFPHRSIPHYVWIDQKGILRAVSRHKSITEENLVAAIKGDYKKITLKNDAVDFDRNRPLFFEQSYFPADSILFSSVLAPPHPDLPSSFGRKFDAENKKLIGMIVLNQPLSGLYSAAIPELGSFPQNRFLITGADATKHYCYELLCAPDSAEKVEALMKAELDRIFKLKTGVLTREVECWVLAQSGAKKILRSTIKEMLFTLYDKDRKDIMTKGAPPSALMAYLNRFSSIPVEDETNIDYPIDLEFPAHLSFEELVTHLGKAGFRLTKEKRKVKVFVAEPATNQ